jgi:hypothetical protein
MLFLSIPQINPARLHTRLRKIVRVAVHGMRHTAEMYPKSKPQSSGFQGDPTCLPRPKTSKLKGNSNVTSSVS